MGVVQRVCVEYTAIHTNGNRRTPRVVSNLDILSHSAPPDGLSSRRLLEYATNYFDLASFPAGETKAALRKALDKKAGKSRMSKNSTTGGERPKKKAKKNGV